MRSKRDVGGALSSSDFIFDIFMINKDNIKSIAETWMLENGFFLVDLIVSPDNVVSIEMESEKTSVNIDDCVALSRHIEESVDREVEDYSLEVSSAGIGQPFKVLKQYFKHIGKDVEVSLKNGKRFVGVLEEVQEDSFRVSVMRKVKPEGAKRPQMVPVDETYPYSETVSVKYKLEF